MSCDARLAAYSAVSTDLALLSDRALQQALAAAAPIGSGIAGAPAHRGAALVLGEHRRFELSQEERSFFERHQDYDRRYGAMYMSQWLVTALFGGGRDERESRLRAYARGEAPTGMPERAAAILARDAPTAVAMTDFFHALQHESRQTPYPAER